MDEKKKGGLAVIIASKPPKSKMAEEKEDKSGMYKEMGDEILSAIKSGDSKSLVMLLKDLIKTCQSEE